MRRYMFECLENGGLPIVCFGMHNYSFKSDDIGNVLQCAVAIYFVCLIRDNFPSQNSLDEQVNSLQSKLSVSQHENQSLQEQIDKLRRELRLARQV